MIDFSDPHATVLVAVNVDSYDERKAGGRCTVKHCIAPASDDSSLCPRHHEAQKLAKRRYAKARRKAAKQAGLCQRCCVERAAQKATLCVPCMDEVGGLRKRNPASETLVATNVDNHRRRVAERMIAWENSPQNEGRMRMRGGKRGAPSVHAENAIDLRDIARYVSQMTEKAAYAESDEVKAMPKVQQASVRAEAGAWGLLLVRTTKEFCRRNGYPLPEQADHNITDGDED